MQAISKLQAPSNKKELQTLMGMVNYVRSFLPNLSELSHPLRELLKKNVIFQWNNTHDECLQKIKTDIMSSSTLKIFDEKKEITIQCDASKYGLGCCLLQDRKPICFASRSLSETEINYPQIDKEFLAIVFACHKFHNYIYGRKVNIITDHKPLVSIMKKDMHKINSVRLQRIKIRLMRYRLNVSYVPGKFLYIADCLSRNFDCNVVGGEIDDLNELVHSLNISEKRQRQFCNETEKDDVLNELKNVILNGWPNRKDDLQEKIKFFWKFRNDLYCENGLIFFNERIIIPEILRNEMLDLLHNGHFGIEKTKSRARSLIYWPGIDDAIENKVTKCATCQKFRSSNIKEPLMPHEIPDYPFQKIGLDIMEFAKKDYLVLCDYYSKFLDIIPLKNKTAAEVIHRLKDVFSIHGLPKKIIADNMPFNSFSFQQFCASIDCNIITSSPHYPRSNGLAERFVQTSKQILKKCADSNTDLWLALLEFRNLPIKGMNLSSVELLMNRKTRTLLPGHEDLFKVQCVPSVKRNLEIRNEKSKWYYDRNSKARKDFVKGESVWYKDRRNGWVKALIKDAHSAPRSYFIELENGAILRRNSCFLRADRTYSSLTNTY